MFRSRGLSAALTLALAVTVASLVPLHADAAAPVAGTVSTATPSVSWTGGPFAVPNATGNVSGTPDCTAPTSCDDFKLTVDTPAGYGDTNQLVVTTTWPNSAADFDVYLLKGGAVVAQAASNADPEVIMTAPDSGTYTVRVVPFNPLGQSYTATAALKPKTGSTAASAGTPASFTNYPLPASFKDANNSGEPSIGTDWKSGASFFQSYLSTYKATFDDSVSPATASWSDVSASATNGCPEGSTTSLDPILWTDHVSGRTLESQLTGQDSATCATNDGGKTWSPSQGGGIPSGVDHQTIGGGPYAPGDALPHLYDRAVYYCSQDIATAFCALSRDGGTTFGAGVPTYNLQQCGGLHGHVKVGPDGTAYLPNKSCGANQALVTSSDNGTSWTVHEVPGTTPSDADPSVGVGSNNTVYFGYVGGDGKPGVAVSHDDGKTWSKPQSVGAEFGIKNAVFPAMVAGDDNRAALAFIGTPTGGNYQDQKNFFGVWHLYIATTYDGGQTWSTADATPGDPVQRGTICTGGTTCGSDRNLLDFIDATIDQQGRVEVAYADGCIKTCVTNTKENAQNGPADAQAAYGTIARQSGGMRLFAQYDPPLAAARHNVTLRRLGARHSGHHVRLRLVVADTGRSAQHRVPVVVRDNGRVVRRWSVTLSPGQRKVLHLRYFDRAAGRHRIVAKVDPRRVIRESNERDNRRVVIVRLR